MLSLYIHIPFCTSKCAYCSFNSFPINQLNDSELRIANYITSLKKEIDHYAEILKDKKLKTLYIGGGTPSRIGSSRIIDIIEYIRTKFDFENLAELSIELNPYPEEEVLDFVEVLNKKYSKISRLRYSFGIQSFDDEVLKITGRAYNFTSIVEFLRSLSKHKQENNVFNFDFIAFGKFQVSKNGFKQLWHEFKREFFQKFLESGYVDSISLYTLEGLQNKIDGIDRLDGIGPNPSNPSNLSPCHSSKWHGSDEEIMEEFLILKEMVENEGFARYEISNFAHAGKASIHNMVYRNMEPYIGLGLSASSFLPMQNADLVQSVECRVKDKPGTINPELGTLNSEFGVRRTNTGDIKQYIQGQRVDEKEVQMMNESDKLIEEFFLRLRTREGISDISKFESVLVSNYEGLITNYEGAGLVIFDGIKIRLTDEGMNVYNSIITDLLQKL